MVERVLCPVLVRRDEELAALEDALLAAHRGESRFVLLAGEAGIGKTRLTSELAASARKLGCAVLWGSCSEAELTVPYLPFAEAIGNHLAAADVERLAETLGPARRELAQLFPQLSDGSPPEPGQDPAQAKLRLFEAFVSLLSAVAREQPVLLVVDDVHWADESTRELLDHFSRRLAALSILLVATYRSDELHRRHALVPAIQSWRRSGVAETVKLEPLPPAGVSEMIRVMFDSPEVEEEFRNLMYERSEGNPFVLEEMLKEAIERGDIFRTAAGWDRKAIGDLQIPETVRDSILFRVDRLDPAHVTTLQAAAVLGRSFDHTTLLAVSDCGQSSVEAALEAAIGQQLIEEQPDDPSRYRWRHALTQEAITTAMVMPRRQTLHSRAADALAAQPGTLAVDRAQHLLGAARFEEAVPVCLSAADEAERALAFGEAVSLLERALPHVADALERARVVCQIGRMSWLNGKSADAAQFLEDGIAALDALGEHLEAARFRVMLGRCHWEALRSDLALRDFEQARDVLETAGPSAELAVAYLRIAGHHAFELEREECVAAAERAVSVAEAAGADFERLWAKVFLALGYLEADVTRAFGEMDTVFKEAVAKQYWLIAANVTYNDVWSRIHLMQPAFGSRLARLEGIPSIPAAIWSTGLARAYVKHAAGDVRGARGEIASTLGVFEALRTGKMVWRSKVHLAEVLAELGQLEEAVAALPDVSQRSDLQDLVYDSGAQIRVRLARGDVAAAAAAAEAVLANADRLAAYRGTLEVAVEAMLAAGRVDDARALVAAGRKADTPAGRALLDEAEARVLLHEGAAEAAIPLLRSAVSAARELGYGLTERRTGIVLAEALGRSGALAEAQKVLRDAVRASEEVGAVRLAAAGREVGRQLGLELPASAPGASEDGRGTEAPAMGERLVTSLFADVRGYSELTAAASPQELTEQMTSLYRFARTEVERHYGIVDKFAGDAVMATFNVSGSRIDHCVQALEAALALRGKAALLDLRLGIGIAVGPAVLARGASDANVAVRGEATNLAARLQAAAGGGEILLSEDAHRRVEEWLTAHGIDAQRDSVELKGFTGEQTIFRIAAPSPAGLR